LVSTNLLQLLFREQDLTVRFLAETSGESGARVLSRNGSGRARRTARSAPYETPETISQFRDPRIQLILREHRGILATLNQRTQRAQTDLIFRVDGDDISPRTAP